MCTYKIIYIENYDYMYFNFFNFTYTVGCNLKLVCPLGYIGKIIIHTVMNYAMGYIDEKTT